MTLRIKELEIYNLKSIGELKIDFSKKTEVNNADAGNLPLVNLIFGDNGLGKTTILEAISLLGHLTLFAPLSLNIDSSIQDVTENINHIQDLARKSAGKSYAFHPDKLVSDEKYRDELIKYCKNILSIVKFHLSWPEKDDLTGTAKANTRDEIEFCVLIIINPESSLNEKSITSLLGSEGVSDSNLGKHFFLIAEGDENQKKLERLITELAKFRRAISEKHEDPVTQQDVNDSVVDPNKLPEPSLIVSYINTDLNDFGRGADLRESPKNIHEHFGSVMIRRLKLPLVQITQNESYVVPIEKAMYLHRKTILSFQNIIGDLIPDIKINKIELRKIRTAAGISYKTFVTAEAAGSPNGSNAVDIDYFSAGENECIFVFLMLTLMPFRGGIILLDEPELHVHSHMRDRLHEYIYEIANDLEAQVIVSTHESLSVLDGNKQNIFYLRKSNQPHISKNIILCDGNVEGMLKNLIKNNELTVRRLKVKTSLIGEKKTKLTLGRFSSNLKRTFKTKASEYGLVMSFILFLIPTIPSFIVDIINPVEGGHSVGLFKRWFAILILAIFISILLGMIYKDFFGRKDDD